MSSPSRPRITSVSLLGGRLRSQEFHRAIGRPIVALPIGNGATMWSRWLESVARLARGVDEPIALDLLIGAATDAPETTPVKGVIATPRVDHGDVRGSAGVLRDHIEHANITGHVVIANANQVVFGELDALINQLAATAADIAVMPSGDGTGGFIMLARAECLLSIPSKGFIDLKEQGLPALAKKYTVRVAPAPAAAGPTVVRSHGDYLRLLDRLHQGPQTSPNGLPVLEERLSDRFRLIEEGAEVASDAVIQNTVVLSGGKVDSGAALAWCVVCRNGLATADTAVRNRLIVP